MVRSIGWNVLASVLRIIAQTYPKGMGEERPSLEILFAGFTKGVLEASRCADAAAARDPWCSRMRRWSAWNAPMKRSLSLLDTFGVGGMVGAR